jgi:flagellar biosynthesis/type III secretory pathway M-ring protein FliF/YscJ
MDIVNKQLARIQQQLSGLTASQKMLTGALVAIMVMTLLYWGRQAGTAEMEPVLDQDFSTADLGQIQDRLRAKGIAFQNSGGRILVPTERKMEVLADLAYLRLLPSNTESGFERMAAKLTPFSSAKERDAMQNSVREQTCSQVIGMFPDVTGAQVVIDATRERHIGANVQPSAMISITTRGGGAADVKRIAESAAAVVAGAKAGLLPAHVSVIIDGQKQRLRGADGSTAGLADAADHFETLNKYEKYHEDKIRSRFANVPGLLVSVSVKVNTDRVRKQDLKYDPKNTITKEKSTRTSDTESTTAPQAQEPGAVGNVVANGPLDINGAAAGGGETNRTEESETENEVLASKSLTFTESVPGAPTVVSASVGVPRSYLARRVQIVNPAIQTPDDAAVRAYADVELKKIAEAVRASAGMDETTLVSVSQFDDDMPLLAAAPAPQTATMSFPLLIGSHSKEIALGGLALVSLFMVSTMVKRSAPAPALVAAAAAAATPQLPPGESVAGEAAEGNTMLDGMELDEEAVRTQQMLDQVSTLVTDNPDAAASLVKRWLNRD